MIVGVQLPVPGAGCPVESFMFIVASHHVMIAKLAQMYKYVAAWAQRVLDVIALLDTRVYLCVLFPFGR